MLEDILKFLGCEEHEIHTFRILLNYPQGVTVVELSRVTSISRPTLYDHLESLINKGLAKKFTLSKSSLFAPQPLENLQKQYQKKLDHYSNQKKIFTQLAEAIQKPPPQQPRFSLSEGIKSFETVFMDILQTNCDTTSWFWPIDIMLEIISTDQFMYFHRERIKQKQQLNVLWQKPENADITNHPLLIPQANKFRTIKILPQEINLSVGYGIYNNKVAVISNRKEPYAFIVQSAELAKTLQSQFNYLFKEAGNY